MKRAQRTLAILALVTAVGCTMQIQPATPPEESNPPLFINSTDATTPLFELFSEAYLDMQPDMVFEHREANHESNLGYLQDSSTQYVITNHFVASDEMPLWAAPLAQDGLAIITHAENSVSQLTIEQLRRIYRGYITNWQEVGGADLNITLLSREAGSGTRAEFERLVMGQQRTSPNAEVVPSSEATVSRILETQGVIAYIPLSQTTAGIRILAIDGVTPSLETIADSAYPLRYTIYIIGLSEPEGLYRSFIGWMQGTEAQQLIRSRYVPLP